MEGVGSRLGRASSRYGSAPVFSGPVRKWKKQWVSTRPNNNVRGGVGNTNNVAGSKLMLCRWTPRSGNSTMPDETPKRKFRYAPIVDLKEKKKETPDDEAKSRKLNHAITSSTSNDNILTRQSISDIFDEDFEELRTNQPTHAESDVNYDLYLKGCD
ncbi:putative 65-kDa microtubule-associated protein 1-like [Capsicum annuum]|nr:putative 65-kDa microtubule-associated protein 1-like [Capsicum annuum]